MKRNSQIRKCFRIRESNLLPGEKIPIETSLKEHYTETLREIGAKTVENEKQKGWIEDSPKLNLQYGTRRKKAAEPSIC